MRFKTCFTIGLAVLVGFTSFSGEAFARKKKNDGPSIPLIRDAEIEGLIKLYSRPIFKAAALNPNDIQVYLIRDDSINAFVAEGQRLFINSGLLTRAKTPNEVIGVIAHESGHLAGGHLVRLGLELQKASVASIIGTMVGAAAMVGGAAAGQDSAAQAGGGVIMGSQGVAERSLLQYQRGMESAADQAALKFLLATQQSPKGMLDLFQRLANESIAALSGSDPYLYSHPMPLERINVLRREAEKSPYYSKLDPPELLLRHKLMQAKLVGFMNSYQFVARVYPESDKSLPARYARAIALYRKGDIQAAIPVIDSLIADLPSDPYFYELKGQALLEAGQAPQALVPLRKAVSMLPNSGLIQILYAQALLATGSPENSRLALTELIKAKRTEPETPEIYSYSAIAYGQMGDVPHAELATAKAAFLQGDNKLAREKAERLRDQFKPGSQEWVQINDILNAVNKK